MSHATTPPDLEDLAAYVDGRLDAARRAAVEDRLAADEDYYEVFLETTRFQRQLEAEAGGQAAGGPAAGGQAEVVPLRRPSRPRAPWWIGAAAAAAATVLVALGLGIFDRPTALDRLDARVLAEIPGSGELGWSDFRKPAPTLPRPVDAARLGALRVHLHLELEAERPAEAASLARHLDYTADSLGLPTVADSSEALADSLTEGGLSEQSQVLAVEVEQAIDQELEGRNLRSQYALGLWVEVAHLAVLSRNGEALAATLDLGDTPAIDEELAPYRPELERLAETLGQASGNLAEDQWQEAEQLFQELREDITG